MLISKPSVYFILFIFISLCNYSCNSDSEDNNIKTSNDSDISKNIDLVRTTEEKPDELVPILDDVNDYHSVEPVSDVIPSEEVSDFKVVLSVDSLMYLGQSGIMEVWIGDDQVEFSSSKGMKSDEKKIASTVGKFAKITPFAPDFEITPMHTTVCHKIDPNGSEVRYGLLPKDEGNYRVSADIELFETEDCTGISVPKSAKALSVSVGVDMKKEISKKVHELESVAWDKFKIFWVALMTLIFGAAIFVIRRFIKKKTGYDEGPSAS